MSFRTKAPEPTSTRKATTARAGEEHIPPVSGSVLAEALGLAELVAEALAEAEAQAPATTLELAVALGLAVAAGLAGSGGAEKVPSGPPVRYVRVAAPNAGFNSQAHPNPGIGSSAGGWYCAMAPGASSRTAIAVAANEISVFFTRYLHRSWHTPKGYASSFRSPLGLEEGFLHRCLASGTDSIGSLSLHIGHPFRCAGFLVTLCLTGDARPKKCGMGATRSNSLPAKP